MEQIFNFSLTQAEADIVVKSLGKQPYDVVGALIAKLQVQFKEQSEKGKTEKPEEKKD